MLGDITKTSTLLNVQGDTVLVQRNSGKELILTLVHVVDPKERSLRLVNRTSKDRKPDWKVNQAFADAMQPARPNKLGVKWEVTTE